MTIFRNTQQLKPIRKQLRRSQTPAETKLWQILRAKRFHDLKFYRQYSIGRYVADFYCPELRLVIELDGSQHALPENQMQDIERSRFIEANKITVIRFWNNEILNETDSVLRKLEQMIEANRAWTFFKKPTDVG